MTTTTGERVAIWGALGVALISFAGAGGLWTTRLLHTPPAVNVQVPAPIPQPAPTVIIQQMPAPVPVRDPTPEKGDLLSASKGRHVTDIDVKMKHDAVSMGPKRKPKKKAQSKLKRDWKRAEQSFPSLFNMGK